MLPSQRSLVALLLVMLYAGGCTTLPATPAPPAERWGFTAPWDARSAASMRLHGAQLDAVVTGWIPLDSLTGAPFTLYRDMVGASGTTSARRMALVTSFHGSSFHPEPLRALALHPDSLSRVSSAIAERTLRGGYRGLVLDFEGMTPADTGVTRAVVASLVAAAHARGIAPVVVALPASDTAGYPARLFATADLLMVMLYDQHWATSPAGAIAAPEWVRRTLATRVAESGASRMVAALPLYGYQWRATGEATTIGYDDARRLAAEAGVALDRDPATSTLHATRSGADGWELWVSDAVLLAQLRAEVLALGVRRLAFWRLGLEDPSFWSEPAR
jgi:spore germination protein YaaH